MSHSKKIKGPFEVQIKTPERELSRIFTDASSITIATSTATDIGLPEHRDNLEDVIKAVDNLFRKQNKEESNHLSFGLELGHPNFGYVKIFFRKESASKK
jgi:hypothetical protein